MSNVRTETQTQFWRESEQEWVDHLFIRTWGPRKDSPAQWRTRTITITTEIGPWEFDAK